MCHPCCWDSELGARNSDLLDDVTSNSPPDFRAPKSPLPYLASRISHPVSRISHLVSLSEIKGSGRGKRLYNSSVAAQNSGRFSGRSATLLLCVFLFVVAFGIRLMGIGWGLKNDLHNDSYHPDEPVIFDYIHKSHVYRGPKETEYYNYGTLFYAIVRASEVVGTAVGQIHRPESLNVADVRSEEQWDQLNAYASEAILWGRYASALFGALTCVVIFVILRRFATTLGAVAGAALVAFGSPAHIEHSRFQTVDVISIFFVALGTLAALRLLRSELVGQKRWIAEVALAAAIAGCAASTRYSDGLLLLSVWAALAVRRPKGWPFMAVIATAVTAVAFASTTPGFVTDHDYFMSNLHFQADHVMNQLTVVFVGRPPGYIYDSQLLLIGIGYATALLGLAGLLYPAIKLHAWALVTLAFFIPYFISIAFLHTMYLRYGFPLYVGIALGFGYAISAIQLRSNTVISFFAGRLKAPRHYHHDYYQSKNRLLCIGSAAAVATVALFGLESSQSGIRGVVAFTGWMMNTDPRDEAGQYLKAIAAQHPGLEVGLVAPPYFTTPAVLKDGEFIYYNPELGATLLARSHDPHVSPVSHLHTPPYVTYTNYEFEDAQRLKNVPDLPQEFVETSKNFNNFYEWLHTVYNEDKKFGENGPEVPDLQYIRPEVTVLKRRDLPW